MKMQAKRVALAATVTLLSWTCLCLAMPGKAQADEPTITITGESEVKVVPDIVKISIGIEARSKTVAAASEEVEKKLKGVLEFLKSSGVENQSIQTEFITIDPILRDNRPVASKGQAQVQVNDPFGEEESPEPIAPIGYRARRQLTIAIRDLKKFEDIYKGLIERGINRMDGIQFVSSQEDKHKDVARKAAVRNARDKAQAMAGQLGAKLDSIKTMREQADTPVYGGYRSVGMGDPFGGSSAPAPLSAGEIAIRSSVEIVFVLGNAKLEK